MKKQKTNYHIYRYKGKMLEAKKEAPFDISITARLLLDQLCYEWNKEHLQKQFDIALDEGDHDKFMQLSEQYRSYLLH